MSSSKTFLIICVLAIISIGVYMFYYTHKDKSQVSVSVQTNDSSNTGEISTTHNLPSASTDNSPANAQFTAMLEQGQKNEERKRYESMYDEYGFRLDYDLGLFNESKLLYSENGYSYMELLRETEGPVPVVRVSSSSKEYLGLSIDVTSVMSPDKKKFAFIQDSPAIGIVGRLCVAQIYPKKIECVSPNLSIESYAVTGGDYEQLFTKGEWITNDTYQYSVFTKDPSARAAVEGSQPIRTETFIFR